MSETRQRYARAAHLAAQALNKVRPGNKLTPVLAEMSALFERPASPKPLFAQPPKSEWATMREEITRKALEAVQGAMVKHQAGEISGRELWLIADALFDTTHGLIEQSPSKVIYQVRQELQEHAPA